MKRFALLILIAAVLAACDNSTGQTVATSLPPAPTVELSEPPAESPVATDPALVEVVASPTAEPPTDAPTVEPTIAVPTLTPMPTDEPPTDEPTAETLPTEPPATEPAPVELFAPGQQAGSSLVEGEAVTYLVQGRRFQPLILFVEPSNELNIALAVYVGDQAGQATPEGVLAIASADSALAGRPEILVISPDSDGYYTFVVRAVAGQGSITSHLYDLTTPARGVAVQQPDTLAAGEERVYTVMSNGPRPVIAVARPTDPSDIALDIMDMEATVLTTANYSGPGGVETAYVLPLGATSYSIKVREASGGSAAFQILVITLE